MSGCVCVGKTGVQLENMGGLIKKLYLEHFESLLVVLGDFVRSDQLSVVAVA